MGLFTAKAKAASAADGCWADAARFGPVKLASVDFRDGQQSLIATRMRTEDMLPVLPLMDEIGYACIEMWGGATFDSCIRFLQEDPWERVRQFKRHVKKTPLRMLLRGQNLLGYTPYPDDVVRRFVTAAASAGIDIFLTFDGLNDIRNCESGAKAALAAGKRVEGNIQFTSSPVHTVDSFVRTAREYVDIGASAVHLEDMGGMIDPMTAARTVEAVKKAGSEHADDVIAHLDGTSFNGAGGLYTLDGQTNHTKMDIFTDILTIILW